MSRHGIEGVRCPKCGQDEDLWVIGLAWFTVTEDGAEQAGKPDGDVEWGADAPARCPKCGFEGNWSEFFYDEENE
jgi:hypothetical protein